MNVEPIDLGDELRQGVKARFDLSPVVIGLPMAHELTHGRQRHALGIVSNGFLLGRTSRRQTVAEIDKIRKMDVERADGLARPLRTRAPQHAELTRSPPGSAQSAPNDRLQSITPDRGYGFRARAERRVPE
jgi:hypothetical protein